jgi:hypothetical protein
LAASKEGARARKIALGKKLLKLRQWRDEVIFLFLDDGVALARLDKIALHRKNWNKVSDQHLVERILTITRPSTVSMVRKFSFRSKRIPTLQQGGADNAFSMWSPAPALKGENHGFSQANVLWEVQERHLLC